MSEDPLLASGDRRPSPAQRRLLAVVAGIGVAALAAAAFVLSYDDLRALAAIGGAPKRYRPLYPAMVDGLVVVIIASILVARHARWWSRAVRWALLTVLVAAVGAAGVQRSVKGYEPLSDDWVSGGVAAAPWVVLLVAVWLWLAMFKHARRALPSRREKIFGHTERTEHPEEPTRPEESDDPFDGAILPGMMDEDEEEIPRDVPRIEGGADPWPPYAPEPEPALVAADQEAEIMRDESDIDADEEDVPPTPPATLPTDVKLVGRPEPVTPLHDTDPDGFPMPSTDRTWPEGIAVQVGTDDPADQDVSAQRPGSTSDASEAPDDARAENPDADLDTEDADTAKTPSGNAEEVDDTDDETPDVEATPPSDTLRSSPTPPR